MSFFRIVCAKAELSCSTALIAWAMAFFASTFFTYYLKYPDSGNQGLRKILNN